MPIQSVIAQAQEYLRAQNISGWLLYDYRDMNPIFWDTVGQYRPMLRARAGCGFRRTRRRACW